MMESREIKVPKFKRCKIARQQLIVLTQHFGASPGTNANQSASLPARTDQTSAGRPV
jgi:hypothetical protein